MGSRAVIAEKPSRVRKVAVGSLSILNRMPQGQTVNDSFSYADNCGPGFPFFFDVFIPTNVAAINYAMLSFRLRAFRTYNTFSATATGAGSNHAHGNPSTNAESGHHHTHTHNMTVTPGAAVGRLDAFSTGIQTTSVSGTVVSPAVDADSTGSSGHSHSIGNTGGEASHTHPVSISSVLGLFEGAVATGVSVKVNSVDRTSALGGPFNADQAEISLDPTWLNIGAWNTVELTPTGLGRIIGHLRTTFFMQSA
jgi:hypothetical protein